MQCSHYPECGGCTRQHLSYEDQLSIKTQMLKELFAPHLREDPTILQPIIPSPMPWRYRNKMEFHFSQDKAGRMFLGLMKKRSRVVDLKECYLISPWYLEVLRATKKWWQETGLAAYHWRSNTGSLRTLTLREGLHTGDRMVMLTVSGNPVYAPKKSHLQRFVQSLSEIFPDSGRLSLFLRIQQIQKKHPTQFYEWHLAGPDHIVERLHIGNEEYHFRISPSSFFQPNPLAAEKLFKAARDCISQPKAHILDLYAGCAAFSMIFSRWSHRISAIEINPYALFDAEENLRKNDIHNATLHRGDVTTLLPNLIASWKEIPDLVIVDPPRGGLDNTMIDTLLRLQPKEILYISCNPNTQSSNLTALTASKYKVQLLQPVDQFPHTIHVEMIALLEGI
jgi:23S rRNA (uracil1939-C5)-methyltransferase